jgi:hypothetical protein
MKCGRAVKVSEKEKHDQEFHAQVRTPVDWLVVQGHVSHFSVLCPPPKVECGECGATVELTELGAHLEKYAPLNPEPTSSVRTEADHCPNLQLLPAAKRALPLLRSDDQGHPTRRAPGDWKPATPAPRGHPSPCCTLTQFAPVCDVSRSTVGPARRSAKSVGAASCTKVRFFSCVLTHDSYLLPLFIADCGHTSNHLSGA